MSCSSSEQTSAFDLHGFEFLKHMKQKGKKARKSKEEALSRDTGTHCIHPPLVEGLTSQTQALIRVLCPDGCEAALSSWMGGCDVGLSGEEGVPSP